MELEYAPGATPLDPDEATGLIPSHIVTQADLNAWEQINITKADQWASRQRRRNLLDEGFVRDLHRQMFDKTWRWAGTFRSSDKNIGVPGATDATCCHDPKSWLQQSRQPPQRIVQNRLRNALDLAGLARRQIEHADLVHKRYPLGFASRAGQADGKAGVA